MNKYLDAEGMLVLFPIDFRYRWNLHLKEHRELATQLRQAVSVETIFDSPRCTPWSRSAVPRDPDELGLDRDYERLVLMWMHEEACSQSDAQAAAADARAGVLLQAAYQCAPPLTKWASGVLPSNASRKAKIG